MRGWPKPIVQACWQRFSLPRHQWPLSSSAHRWSHRSGSETFTVGLGLGLGYYLLGEGVVVAVSTALLAGALYCSTMIQRELRVESPMFDSVDKLYLAVCFVAAVGALGLHSALDNAVWIPSLAGLVLLAWAFRLHPRFRTMTRFIPETVTGTQDK